MNNKAYLNHVGLVNFNESDALKFFKEILGFNEQYRFVLTPQEAEKIFGLDQKVQVLVFAKDDLKLEIFIPQKIVPFKPAFNHVCLNVADRMSIVERCKKNGLAVTEIKRTNWVTVFVTDFAGNIFELKEME